jgi:hypothetical protein
MSMCAAKAGGGYTVFNFDDLPDYEPLEVILQMLRHPDSVEQGLEKLLKVAHIILLLSLTLIMWTQVEIDELIDHPQWHDLLQLLADILSGVNSPAEVPVLIQVCCIYRS